MKIEQCTCGARCALCVEHREDHEEILSDALALAALAAAAADARTTKDKLIIARELMHDAAAFLLRLYR